MSNRIVSTVAIGLGALLAVMAASHYYGSPATAVDPPTCILVANMGVRTMNGNAVVSIDCVDQRPGRFATTTLHQGFRL